MPPHGLKPTLIPLPHELRGSRVLLRPYRTDDAEEVFTAIDESREHLRPWATWGELHAAVSDTRDSCIHRAASWKVRDDLTFGIFDLNSGKFLGGTGLHEPNWELRSFEVGYWLRASTIGRGYATDPVRLLVDLAFESLQARRVFLTCDARNEASRRVAERAGFQLEGRMRKAVLAPDGVISDVLVYGKVAQDREGIRDD